MRRSAVAASLALLLGVVLALQFRSLAQDQAEGARKVVSRVPPVYPELARRMQLRGTVKVEATVSATGKVDTTEVVGGSPVLASAAIEAITKWRWAAAAHETKELIEIKFHPE